MTSFASVADFRLFMDAIPAGATEDARIQAALDAATAIISGEIGYTFGTAAAGSQVVYGEGSDTLYPPLFVAGSVTAVSAPGYYEIPVYVERSGALVAVAASSLVARPPYYSRNFWGQWRVGVPYTVAATFGTASVPADIKEACLEIAIAIWGGRDARFSDVVGVAGDGAVAYVGKYSKRADSIIKRYKARANPVRVF